MWPIYLSIYTVYIQYRFSFCCWCSQSLTRRWHRWNTEPHKLSFDATLRYCENTASQFSSNVTWQRRGNIVWLQHCQTLFLKMWVTMRAPLLEHHVLTCCCWCFYVATECSMCKCEAKTFSESTIWLIWVTTVILLVYNIMTFISYRWTDVFLHKGDKQATTVAVLCCRTNQAFCVSVRGSIVPIVSQWITKIILKLQFKVRKATWCCCNRPLNVHQECRLC